MDYGRSAAEKTWTIIWEECDGLFELLGPSGDPVANGPKPKALAKRAFAEGADAVVFDFDLNLDPEK